jgi:hypothetical protein
VYYLVVPEFLKKKLAAGARKKGFTGKRAAGYVYGALNNMGAMHGNQETEKGKAMQHKHDVKKLAKKLKF